MSALALEEVVAERGRVEARVRVVDPAFMRTSAVPEFAERLLALLPNLVRHRCECDSPRGIRAELSDTETAHAFEHVALEVMALAGSPRSLRGETAWDFARDGRGVFRVSLEYADEQVAIAAVRIASDVIDYACFGTSPPDVASQVARLRP